MRTLFRKGFSGYDATVGTVESSRMDITTDPGAPIPDPLDFTKLNQAFPSDIQASSLSVFGCDSIQLAGQYPQLQFTGVESGADHMTSLGAMDAAMAGEVTARASGADSVVAANAALQKNANLTPLVNDKDGDRVKRPDDK